MCRGIGAAGTQGSVGAWSGGALKTADQPSCLMRYLEGWADANPLKILAATARGYRFDDPLVGVFTRRSFRRYFDFLRDQFAFEGSNGTRDVAFRLRGPMTEAPGQQELQFWREAPSLGLTGVTVIVLGRDGVVAERVAYDLNMASGILQGSPGGCRTIAEEQY